MDYGSLSKGIPYGTLSKYRRKKMSPLNAPHRLFLICIYVVLISILAYASFGIYEYYYHVERPIILIEIVKIKAEANNTIYITDPTEEIIAYDKKCATINNLDIKYT